MTLHWCPLVIPLVFWALLSYGFRCQWYKSQTWIYFLLKKWSEVCTVGITCGKVNALLCAAIKGLTTAVFFFPDAIFFLVPSKAYPSQLQYFRIWKALNTEVSFCSATLIINSDAGSPCSDLCMLSLCCFRRSSCSYACSRKGGHTFIFVISDQCC